MVQDKEIVIFIKVSGAEMNRQYQSVPRKDLTYQTAIFRKINN
jgi:hypothetical protein